MSDERWVGKVDQKLDTICSNLTGIKTWMEHREKLDTQRFGKLEVMIDHDKQQREELRRLTAVLLGNGQEGLTSKVERQGRNLAAYNKLTWLVVGIVTTALIGGLLSMLLGS